MPGIGGGARNRITCPACGRELWEKPVGLQIGPESARCRCGSLVATGKREWAQLTAPERRSFWATRRIIPVLLTAPVTIGIVFGSWRSHSYGKGGMGFDWVVAGWGLLAWAVLFAIDLAAKLVAVRRSLRRVHEGSKQDSTLPS